MNTNSDYNMYYHEYIFRKEKENFHSEASFNKRNDLFALYIVNIFVPSKQSKISGQGGLLWVWLLFCWYGMFPIIYWLISNLKSYSTMIGRRNNTFLNLIENNKQILKVGLYLMSCCYYFYISSFIEVIEQSFLWLSSFITSLSCWFTLIF